MAVRIKVDMSGVTKKISDLKKNSVFGIFVANEAMSGMEDYVPFRDGVLVDSAKASPFKVTYTAPYARYIWNGVSKSGAKLNISKEMHDKATSHWEEHYALAHGDELARAAKKYAERFL